MMFAIQRGLAALALGCTFLGVTLNASAAPASQVASQPEAVVHLNTAQMADLLSLKMVGHKRAQAILDYRQAHGKFQSLEDLKALPNWKPHFVEQLILKNGQRLTL